MTPVNPGVHYEKSQSHDVRVLGVAFPQSAVKLFGEDHGELPNQPTNNWS